MTIKGHTHVKSNSQYCESKGDDIPYSYSIIRVTLTKAYIVK